jgi:hypothetical protein
MSFVERPAVSGRVVGAVVLLRDAQAEFSRMVACAGLAALTGSQAYAAITRRRR